MIGRTRIAFHVIAIALLVCLIFLSSFAYATPPSSQKGTQQMTPVTPGQSALVDPNKPPQGSITITLPQRGAIWATGSYEAIQWTCSGTRSNLVDIWVYKNGQQYVAIDKGVSGGRDAYLVPWDTLIPGNYELRIISEDDARVQAVQPITVVATTATLTTPPFDLMTRSNYGITWTYTGNLGETVTLNLLDKGGAVVRTIASNTLSSRGVAAVPTAMGFPWTVPNPACGQWSCTYKFQLIGSFPTSVTSNVKATKVLATSGFFNIRFTSVNITTGPLSMTGMRFQPVSITTGPLSMTGMRFQPVSITTDPLNMTGMRFQPVSITTDPLNMTGMR